MYEANGYIRSTLRGLEQLGTPAARVLAPSPGTSDDDGGGSAW